MKIIINHTLLVFLITALIGCAGNETMSTGSGVDSSIPCKRSTMPYQVALLDRVTVNVKGSGLSSSPVDQDGVLTLPSGQKIKALGLSPEELRDSIKKADKDVTDVKLEEFRGNRVTIVGEVFHQIHVEMSDAPMRVMDVVAAANGFTPLANSRRVTLLRQNAGQVEVYELNMRDVMQGKNTHLNMLIKPGDVITVPRNFL